MGKVKDRKKSKKAQSLKHRRQAKEGRNLAHNPMANSQAAYVTRIKELENEVKRLRPRVLDAEAAMRDILSATSGSRWKEAKHAHAVAAEFLAP